MGLFNSIAGIFRGPLRSSSAGGAYVGAGRSRRLKNWRTSNGSPDGELLNDLPLLRRRARDLYRNNAVGRGVIKLLVSNVVGRGLKMQSTVDRETIAAHNGWSTEETNKLCDNFEKRIERLFNWWAESTDCDPAGQMTFYEKTSLLFTSVLSSGEVFVTLPVTPRKHTPFSLQIGLVEADQVESPLGVSTSRTNRDGVVTTPNGIPLGYWVNTNQERWPEQYCYIPKHGDVSGRPLILHLYKADRPGQTRGVPFIAPIIENIKKLDDYKRSELDAAEMSANLVAVIESDNPNALNGNVITGSAGEQTSQDIRSEGVDLTMAPGALWQLNKGEKLNQINPVRPNTAYEAFMLAQYTECGMGTNIPFEMITKRFNSSYSASRASRVEFEKEKKVWHEWLEFHYCHPVYKEFLIDVILNGLIDAPGFFDSFEVMQAYLGSTWSGEAMGMIDPTKEIEAAASRVKYGFSTATQEAREMTGNDYASNLQIQNREKQMRESVGIVDPFSDVNKSATLDLNKTVVSENKDDVTNEVIRSA